MFVGSAGKSKKTDAEPSETTGKKYAHLIKTMIPFLGPDGIREDRRPSGMARGKDEEFQIGPGNADQLIWMYGKDLEGLNLNFTWGFDNKPGIWHRRRTGARCPWRTPNPNSWSLSVLTLMIWIIWGPKSRWIWARNTKVTS